MENEFNLPKAFDHKFIVIVLILQYHARQNYHSRNKYVSIEVNRFAEIIFLQKCTQNNPIAQSELEQKQTNYWTDCLNERLDFTRAPEMKNVEAVRDGVIRFKKSLENI